MQCYGIVEQADGSRVRVPDVEMARVLVKDLAQSALPDDSLQPPSLPAFTPAGGGPHRIDPDAGGIGAQAVFGGHAVDSTPEQVKELLRHTRVGRRVLASLESMPVHARFELMGGSGHRDGEWVESALAATVFTSGNDFVAHALALVHEFMHAKFFVDGRTVHDPLSMSIDEYVWAMVVEETECFRLMAGLAVELRTLGLEIPLQVTEAAYNEAYDKAVERRIGAALTPEQIHQQAHASAMRACEQEVATFRWVDGRSYRRYYRDGYEALRRLRAPVLRSQRSPPPRIIAATTSHPRVRNGCAELPWITTTMPYWRTICPGGWLRRRPNSVSPEVSGR